MIRHHELLLILRIYILISICVYVLTVILQHYSAYMQAPQKPSQSTKLTPVYLRLEAETHEHVQTHVPTRTPCSDPTDAVTHSRRCLPPSSPPRATGAGSRRARP